MTEPQAVHSTFTVERTYPKSAEIVFAALADPAKKQRWFAESDKHVVEDFESDFRVGGAERLRYRFTGNGPVQGMIIESAGRFEDIVPNRRVVTSSSMWLMDACFSSSLVTMELLPDVGGTRLVCTFQGAFYEGADGPRIREMGWQALLDKLGHELGNELAR